jgi:hypothetical protein
VKIISSWYGEGGGDFHDLVEKDRLRAVQVHPLSEGAGGGFYGGGGQGEGLVGRGYQEEIRHHDAYLVGEGEVVVEAGYRACGYTFGGGTKIGQLLDEAKGQVGLSAHSAARTQVGLSARSAGRRTGGRATRQGRVSTGA